MPDSTPSLTVSFDKAHHNRSRSSSGSRPVPHSPDTQGEPSKPVPWPSEPSTRKKTFHLPLGSPSSPIFSSGSRPTTPQLGSNNQSDPERQPLISTVPYPRNRWTYLFASFLMLAIIATVIGFGGWRIGQGAGGDRWPGGPHKA